jgi:hypothetical protein
MYKATPFNRILQKGTGLSSHEVNQPGSYRDVTDTTVVAQSFGVVKRTIMFEVL